ncbi:hypothetical protein SCQ64_15480, partial [Legionella pneumophila serogroup 1]
GLFANLGQAEVSGCFDNEHNRLAVCRNCLINGFKLRTRPKSKTGKYIFFGLVEVNGIYTGKDKFIGDVDPNSGGNLVNIIPSLWFSTKKLFFQLGVALPIIQTLNGEQNKIHYNPVATAGITFD